MYISSVLFSLYVGIFVFNNTALSILENYSITIGQYLFLVYLISFFAVYAISSFFTENLIFALIFNTYFGALLLVRVIK